GEQCAGDADRSAAANENVLIRRDVAARNGVGSDREKLDHRGLIERDAVSGEHEALRSAKVLHERAVATHAEQLERLATTRSVLAARIALAARELRHDIPRNSRPA